jgi:flagellar biosynthesis protein FlhG
LGQAIYRIADKVISTPPHEFDTDFNPDSFNDNFQEVEDDANEDFNFRLSGIDDIVSSGSLSISELAEMIKTQQYEITQLRKENNLLKSKLIKATQQGFKL